MFEHIKDCWNYLRKATDYDDLVKRTGDLPRWSGDWEILQNDDNTCRVINSYWDEQYQDYQEDVEDFSIEFE